jgi:hypothetical protein
MNRAWRRLKDQWAGARTFFRLVGMAEVSLTPPGIPGKPPARAPLCLNGTACLEALHCLKTTGMAASIVQGARRRPA